MKLFDVYPILPIEPVGAQGSWFWDSTGSKYLDLYGGHAVISIGHNHPYYVTSLKRQLEKISFYSNSVKNPLQETLARKLGEISNYPNYQLFLCNSGAEANENALKLASMLTGRKKVIAFKKSFHGRTSGALAVTDNPEISSPFNSNHEVTFLPLNDEKAFSECINNSFAAVIIEGVQGVGGINVAENSFLKFIERLTHASGALLILDEIQSGYGRSGKFFSHQHANIKPDIITIAKGMGNGFPIGGLLIHPAIKPWPGMLGTTFGGNHLACIAALVVLEVIEKEDLITHSATIGNIIIKRLSQFKKLLQVRGRGLMIGFEPHPDFEELRKNLLFEHRIITGESKPNTIRLLPPLNINLPEIEFFFEALLSIFSKAKE